MNERLPERNGILHTARCLGELAVMYVQEKVRDFKSLLDDDPWPDDDVEDQAIHSELWGGRE